LTNVPTRPDNLNIVTSYAGYTEDEDSILWQLYKKGIDQAEGREEKDARFWFKWFSEELYAQVPWVKPTYLPEQKKRLRESTYARLHCNVWSSGEESFIDPQVLEACIHPDYKRGLPFEGRLVAGVDIGLKHDSSAIALVGALDAKTLAIIDHVVYVPFEGVTLDLERTVEAKLLAYFKIYDLVVVYYDPFQFARSAKTLEKRGLAMHEYPQTVGNTVAMSETLAGVLSNQTLLLYEDMELRTHLLNARARQSQRGWRLVKKTQAGKIDLAVALAMAAQAAVDKFLLAEDSYFKAEDFVRV